MIWNYAILAFVSVFSLTSLLSLIGTKSKISNDKPIESYLLANGQLAKSSVINLLLSSSFGINALLYAVWLGYSIGVWALLIQLAWGLSFLFLSYYSKTIKKHKSLHELLGFQLDKYTRIVAGCCSLIGIMYLMGWEVGVGSSVISGLLSVNNEFTKVNADSNSIWLTIAVITGCLFYTVLGGLRGNAKADKVLNFLKLATIGLLTIFIYSRFNQMNNSETMFSAFFPPISKLETNLGWWGFATSIAFNISWQFVDNSSWQSIIAGSATKNEDTKSNIKWSGLVTFFIPGVLGAILGIALNGIANITPENIFVLAVSTLNELSPEYSSFIVFLAFVSVFASIMSMIDGLFLASTYTFIIDILHPNKSIVDIDKDERQADKILLQARLALIVIALIATLGVRGILEWSGLNLFQFVFIVIITQLSLAGPVLVSLWERTKTRFPPWGAIIISLFIGFGSVVVGSTLNEQSLIDGAGTFTLLSSVLISFITTAKKQ